MKMRVTNVNELEFILDIKTVHDKYGNTLRKMCTSAGLVQPYLSTGFGRNTSIDIM